MFATGIDYAGDLRRLGIHSQTELETAARDAWARFGTDWLAGRPSPIDAYQVAPWALRTYGEPTCQ